MRKNKVPQKKIIFSLVLGLLVLTGYIFSGNSGARFNPKRSFSQDIPASHNYDYDNILVARVVDGDTLKLESGEYVRLLGIDTPEMHESAKLHRDARRSGESIEAIQKAGRKSYEFTRQLAEGKRVRLEFDAEKYDKYNRILAYVFLADGTFLNARIVEEGYASITHYKLNVRYADLFLKLYQQARENKRGLWR
ncbi:MAG: thermonuclease family protein [Candidatus Omnitrophica bacterium]|jgi:micrococcal nuclease|nr:thermonuclease family protein [Candidatus Omnitrophota bacterium]